MAMATAAAGVIWEQYAVRDVISCHYLNICSKCTRSISIQGLLLY